MEKKATLTYEGKTWEFPVIEGSEGERGIDIGDLRARTGMITLDPSLGNTGACTSNITFIDGEKGILRYRGIPVEDFAAIEHPNFIEVAWLLIFGRLPRPAELEAFSHKLSSNALLHESFHYHFEGFPSDAPPMAMLSAMINSLSCFHYHILTQRDDDAFEEAVARVISKVRTIAAFSYRMVMGLPMMYPDPQLRYAANFLHMMFSMPYDRYEVDPVIEDALNLILILHADHEQNCSTTAVRVAGSSMANLYTSLAAGISALWGSRHGGANVAVIEMLEKIRAGGLAPKECLAKAKDKNSDFRLMGFGHRIYKNFDPRARILKGACDRVLGKLGVKDPLLDIARELETLALADDYFIERKLYPNVDFYSGIILRAMGIPTNMFTVMFAIGRLPGWIAQWKEQHDAPNNRICRPRQIYTGPTLTHYVPRDQRG